MPLYEYRCDACGVTFELIRKFSDPPLETCPTCGSGPVQKLVSSPAFQFKGSGWYITDYARKSGGETAGESKAGESKGKDTPTASSDKETKEPAAKDSTPPAKESKPAEKPATTTPSSKDS